MGWQRKCGQMFYMKKNKLQKLRRTQHTLDTERSLQSAVCGNGNGKLYYSSKGKSSPHTMWATCGGNIDIEI